MSEIERCGLQTIYETPYSCSYCGDHIAIGWAFCPECGTPTGQKAAELDREKNPMTWNDRINQMTVEEKADWLLIEYPKLHKIAYDYAWKNRKTGKFCAYYIERMAELLASPYKEANDD